MSTNNFYKSDLNKIYNIVQNNQVLYPKELIIYTLRDVFSKDYYYRYNHDHWGFPQTPDHTDLPLNAGFNNEITTRLFIGESYRGDVIYYPAVIVRHGGSQSIPISFNMENSVVKYDKLVFQDGYGNIKTFPNPSYFIFAGAWEGSINIEIQARDMRTRDDLVDLISLLFVNIAHNDLLKAGLVVKSVSSSAATETQDRNFFVFKQTITLQIRSEWHRHIPIGNIIDIINMSIDFSDGISIDTDPNFAINTSETLTDMLANI